MFKVNKLKISGFKSFAHPTEILIEDGVTGIIGPNGCGKSNIFEAIRWVMGESSSKSLRSGSMDDVIFNGTQNIPAKNFAEVTIELDEFSGEVPGNILNDKKLEISRTIERGVGSFYKINNKDVRAKDISILFYDSGSGPRSSSIISQGNIDQVINSKPIDRKIILEDAAGISGLQARRHESELKLQATETNLEKIDLNLNNFHDQKKDLARQARQAEKYERISSNIKFFQSILVFTQWKKVFENLQNEHEAKKDLSSITKTIINKISINEDQLNSEKQKLSLNIRDREELNKKLFEIESEINKHNIQLEEINNKKNEIQRFLGTIDNDIEVENERYIEMTKYADNLKDKIATPTDTQNKKKELIELTTRESELKSKLKQFETIFVNEMQLSLGEEFKFDNLKENKENLEKQKKEIAASISERTKNLQAQQKSLSDQKILLDRSEENFRSNQQNILEKKKLINDTIKRNDKINIQIKSLEKEIEICSTKLTQIRTELKTLNHLTKSEVLSNDLVVNLLKIKKGYENAVYSALNFELDAKLSNSSKSWLPTSLKNIEPIENSLSNFVKAPAELDLILSQIGFINDKKNVRHMQKSLKVGQSLVDLNGSIWRWDGFISEDNLEKKKLIDAQLKIKNLMSEEEKYEKDLHKLNIQKNHVLNIQSENNTIVNNDSSALERLYKDSDKNQIALSSLKEKSSMLNFNINDSNEKLKNLNSKYADLEEEIKKIINTEKINNKNERERDDKEEAQKNIESLDLEIDHLRVKISSLKEFIMKDELNNTYSKNDLQKTLKRIDECRQQIQTLQQRKKSYFSEKEKLENLPESIKTKIDHYQGQYNQIKMQIKNNIDLDDTLRKQIINFEKKVNDLNKERENKINDITRVESNLENLNNKEKELRNMIFQQSKIQPEELEQELRAKNYEITNYDEVKIKLDRLTGQREQMGPVNLRAKIEEDLINKTIEDYELERLDLIQALEKLRIAINKINLEGKNRLLKAFESVNKNFADLFKKLFNGGEAKLELVKSDDPLQTGIEIYARPPGKKLSSISLLSGGEKTLTAISLIFSIFLINPSPICILDEVDAALDEPNVEKFCNILKELKKETKTKFLIITHHKITMSSIDRIYGVTMAQKGISDVVSVDFNKIDLKEAV